MHHAITYQMAQARIADLRRHAQRATLARAARPARRELEIDRTHPGAAGQPAGTVGAVA